MTLGKLGKWLGLDRLTREEKLDRLFIALGILAFRVLLDLAYPRIICSAYARYGFTYAPDPGRLILSYTAMLAVLAAFVPQVKLRRPGSILLLLLLIMAFVPNMALFAGMGLPYSFLVMSVLFWLSVSFFYCLSLTHRACACIRLSFIKVKGPQLPATSGLRKYWVMYLAFLLVFAYSISYNHGLSFRISLREAYDLRMSARGNVGGVFMRLLTWSGSIVFPIGIIFAVKDKRPMLLSAMLLGEAAAYSVNGTKTWLFTAVLVLLMVVFIRKDRQIGLLPWVFAFMAAAGFLLGATRSIGDFINNYFIRRVFFSSSLNNYFWIDFFETHAKTLLTNGPLGWLRRFIQVPYDRNVASIISEFYYGDPQSNASSGTIANAFSSFGWPGLVINAFFTVFLAELMDVASNRPTGKVPILYFYPLILSASEYLLNGAIMTTAITYGYIPGLLLIVYLKHQGALDENGPWQLLQSLTVPGERRFSFRIRR